VISERQLIRRGKLWWSRWAPGLPDVWRVMLSTTAPTAGVAGATARQWLSSLTPRHPPRDADLVAETAFGLFASACESGRSPTDLTTSQIELSRAQAVHRIKLLRGTGRDLGEVMTAAHMDIAFVLARRLLEWTTPRSHEVEVQPLLPGSGAIDACRPDMILGSELVEVKMSRSGFRIADLRPVLIYCALARLGTERRIERVALVNPLLGIEWSFELKMLVQAVSGKPPSLFFDDFHKMALGEGVI